MPGEPNEKNAGVNISGGQVSVNGSIVGGDLHVHEAPVPRIASLHQLPPPPGDFTGREAELRELREAILKGGVHISGLQGQGGVGKTALALKLAAELASQFPDAQIHLDLKGASEKPLTAAEALAHIVRSFHPEAKLPERENDLKALFTSVLHDKCALLLMDNVRDAAQVQPLIPPAGSTLLVTSRQTFKLPGLVQKKLDALPPDDAEKLLLKIEPRIGTAAEAIAKSCGYLALALRLAATAIAERADLDPAEYAKKLADESKRLCLLLGSAGDPSVETSISLSYNLLNDKVKAHWRVLGVFPDTFDIPGAAAVWKIHNDITQAQLSDLVRFSMLEWDDTTKRYRLHDLMRDFARRKASNNERNSAALRHARHYLGVLRLAHNLYKEGGDAVMRGLALFDLEWGNTQAGQSWAAAHIQQNLAAAQLCSDYPRHNLVTLRLHPRELISWVEAALTAARHRGDTTCEGNLLGNLGYCYQEVGDHRRAVEYHEQHLAISRKIGSRRGEGIALSNLGRAYASLGEYRRAIEYHERRLAIAREVGDRRGEGMALGNLGNVYDALGDHQRTIEYHKQDLQIAREIGDWKGEGDALGNLGSAYASLAEYYCAIKYLEQRLAIARKIGDRKGEGNGLWNIGLALYKLGERKQAITQAESALRIFELIEAPAAANVRAALGAWRREE